MEQARKRKRNRNGVLTRSPSCKTRALQQLFATMRMPNVSDLTALMFLMDVATAMGDEQGTPAAEAPARARRIFPVGGEGGS